MKVVQIWDQHEGAVVVSMETNRNVYEVVVEWIIDDFEQRGRQWSIRATNNMDGVPNPPGVDEMITVWEVYSGFDD